MAIVIMILTMLPNIIQTIIAIEAAFGSGATVPVPGAAKKQLLMNALIAGPDKIPDAKVAAVSRIVDLTVGTLNAAGTFTTAPTTAPQ